LRPLFALALSLMFSRGRLLRLDGFEESRESISTDIQEDDEKYLLRSDVLDRPMCLVIRVVPDQ
jgi:hypothetical protein